MQGIINVYEIISMEWLNIRDNISVMTALLKYFNFKFKPA